jgi:hypothetical protein
MKSLDISGGEIIFQYGYGHFRFGDNARLLGRECTPSQSEQEKSNVKVRFLFCTSFSERVCLIRQIYNFTQVSVIRLRLNTRILPFGFLKIFDYIHNTMTPLSKTKGSKGGFAERYLGIGALKPPPTVEPTAPLPPMNIALGPFKLNLDAMSGRWGISNEVFAQHNAQIKALQDKIALLEGQGKRADQNGEPISSIEAETRNVQLQMENAKLKFQNKLLIAMCAIAEGDYQKLAEQVNAAAEAEKKEKLRSVLHSNETKEKTPKKERAAKKHFYIADTENEASTSKSSTWVSDFNMDKTLPVPMRYQASI